MCLADSDIPHTPSTSTFSLPGKLAYCFYKFPFLYKLQTFLHTFLPIQEETEKLKWSVHLSLPGVFTLTGLTQHRFMIVTLAGLILIHLYSYLILKYRLEIISWILKTNIHEIISKNLSLCNWQKYENSTSFCERGAHGSYMSPLNYITLGCESTEVWPICPDMLRVKLLHVVSEWRLRVTP